MKQHVPLFESYVKLCENKKFLKDVNANDDKETKAWIGIKNPGYKYSSLQVAMLLKRLKQFNDAKGTHHSVDKEKIGDADLYNIKLNIKR